MSLTLLLRAPGETMGELTFDGGRIVVGRGAGCDLRLPDVSVSLRHASVRATGAEFVLLDEGSLNGTFVGAVRLARDTPRPLRSGDLVRVGRVWLEVRIDSAPGTRDVAAVTRALALSLVGNAMRSLGQEANPSVRVLEGDGAGSVLVLSEEGRAYAIGNGRTSDLVAGEAAWATQVRVVRRGVLVLVRDEDSQGGAWLGDVKLGLDRDVVWRPPACVRVGALVLSLDDPAAAALVEIEAAPDEPLAPEDVPDPPNVSRDAPPSPTVREHRASKPPAVRRAPARWSGTDLAVAVVALSVLGLSVAGLLWLLRM
jgi:hypothetical protein